MQVSHKPITKYQQRLCNKFQSTFGLSVFEIIDATFFHWNTGLNLSRYASVFFTYSKAHFTLSYETHGLDHGFLLDCKDGDSVFFPVKHQIFFWQKHQYSLDDFVNALDELAGSLS